MQRLTVISGLEGEGKTLELMDDYPNNECLNSFDIIYTTLRGDSDRR